MYHGIKMYETQNDYTECFKLLKEMNINSLYISKELAEDTKFIKQVPHSFTTLLIFPVLFDSEKILDIQSHYYARTANGEIAKESWVTFICPTATEVIEDKIARYIEIAKKAEVDYLSIDFIRYFSFWEMVNKNNTQSIKQSCFCPRCLNEFEKFSGIVLSNETNKAIDVAREIEEKYITEFTLYKCHKIESLVHYISCEAKKKIPHIKLSLHIVPWLQNQYNKAIKRVIGQDINRLAKYVDLLSPMCYSHMINESPQWINTYLTELTSLTSIPILPSIQVKECYRKKELTNDEFEKAQYSVLTSKVAGITYWSLEHLISDKMKQKIVSQTQMFINS